IIRNPAMPRAGEEPSLVQWPAEDRFLSFGCSLDANHAAHRPAASTDVSSGRMTVSPSGFTGDKLPRQRVGPGLGDLRVLRGQRARDADRADDLAVDQNGDAAFKRRDVLHGQ